MCKPHRYHGKLHDAGCSDELAPHWHVRCRRCGFTWMQMMLFPMEGVRSA